MKKLTLCALFCAMIIDSHPAEQTQQSWFNSTKENAAKAFNATKKATEKGIDKTGDFLNQTGKATTQGFKAFKKSFDGDKNIESEVEDLSPPYLKVKDYKYCLSIKITAASKKYCLSNYRPALCKESDFLALHNLHSPEPC